LVKGLRTGRLPGVGAKNFRVRDLCCRNGHATYTIARGFSAGERGCVSLQH
jgi:hypothetical protein